MLKMPQLKHKTGWSCYCVPKEAIEKSTDTLSSRMSTVNVYDYLGNLQLFFF